MAALLDTFVDPVVANASSIVAPCDCIVMHDIPGRLRVVVTALKNAPRHAAWLHGRLAAIASVADVAISTVTGSVVVTYDAAAGGRDAVLGGLVSAGLQVVRHHARAPTAPMRTAIAAPRVAMKAIAHCALDLAIETAVVAVI